MKIYIYICCLMTIITSCRQTKSYGIETIQEKTHKRVAIKEPTTQLPMYEITYPKDWEFHPANDTNKVYITNPDGLKVEGESIYKYYAYSNNKSVLFALNLSNLAVDKILSIEDIIQTELVSKFKKEGYEWLKTYPLSLVNNNSIFYSNSTFHYPDEVKTYATEWTNNKNQKKICLIQYTKDASIYTVDGNVTKFEFSADILTTKESDFESFKNEYIKSLESIKWNKNYLDQILNQAYTASTIWKYQTVVRKESLESYLRSSEWHNTSNHYEWENELICLGIKSNEETSEDQSYYGNFDTISLSEPKWDYSSNWDEISN
ncbi:MAG: hypothetical protein R2728_16065 [Chitinophagales bacterium]